ncbi:putative cytochrome P450 [Medicago truncatula]|uniref:Putative cytochrome P450 n=1 Tax=Medicago truncatula TaxID=3880 RepID=A0A396JB93_MEDTR|nr:putative cytochrome P450 [Medicago truncatula]
MFEYILLKKFNNYKKGKVYYAILDDLLGDGIFNDNDQMWNFQRILVRPEFTNPFTRDHVFQLMTEEVEKRLIPIFYSFTHDGRVFDLQHLMRRFSFESSVASPLDGTLTLYRPPCHIRILARHLTLLFGFRLSEPRQCHP